MNKQEAFSYYASQLEGIRESGVLKAERIITTPQSAHIFADGKELLNMCANNYLGLADNRELAEAAKAAYDAYGYGLASVRFICGTQSIHKQLEAAVSRFFGTEDTILYSSCFDANGGLFEVMLTAEDAVISDELNHASIIDGIRLCKAKRYRYKNNDMADLEAQLQAADDKEALFDELMKEYSEDTDSSGNVNSPDGYEAKSGQMVAAFEEAALALQPGQISGIVESTYGYHIILRLPIQAADYREKYVSYLMSQRQQSWLEQFPVETNDEFKKIDPAAFYTQLTALRTAVQAEVDAMQAENSGDSSSSSSGSSSSSSSGSSSAS